MEDTLGKSLELVLGHRRDFNHSEHKEPLPYAHKQAWVPLEHSTKSSLNKPVTYHSLPGLPHGCPCRGVRWEAERSSGNDLDGTRMASPKR